MERTGSGESQIDGVLDGLRFCFGDTHLML